VARLTVTGVGGGGPGVTGSGVKVHLNLLKYVIGSGKHGTGNLI
jgi:hypothetical protein